MATSTISAPGPLRPLVLPPPLSSPLPLKPPPFTVPADADADGVDGEWSASVHARRSETSKQANKQTNKLTN